MTEEKTALLHFLNTNLSLLTLIGFVLVLVWFIDVVGLCTNLWKGKRSLYEKLAKYSFPVGFSALFVSSFISLVYSDYLGVLPCGLCWFQRVFIYASLFLVGAGWFYKDTSVWKYVQVLSVPGLLIALYHEYLQLGYSELIPCPAIASTVDCAKPTFISFGFITYPFMAVVLFVFLLLLSVTVSRYKK